MDVSAPSLVLLASQALPRERDLTALRDRHGVPIIAVVPDTDGVKSALRHGAYATLLEPLDKEILGLTIRSLARPTVVAPFRAARQEHSVGGLTVSIVNHSVVNGGVRHQLTPTEWQLLAFFLAFPGRVHSRRALAVGAWGLGYANRGDQVELFVSRLRRKVERDPARPDLILTAPGGGYKLRLDSGPTGARSAQRAPAALRNAATATGWHSLYTKLINEAEQAVASLGALGTGAREPGFEADAALLVAHAAHFRRRLAEWSPAVPADARSATAATEPGADGRASR